MNEKKIVAVVAGANGSGKSTRINFNLGTELPSYYICPDNLIDFSIEDEKERYIDAIEHARILREEATYSGKSFTFETVFSTQDKLAFLKDCKNNGYYIRAIYIATKNPRINIKRIEERVNSWGA